MLWSFAVAQPLYGVLRENREFFVAHRTLPLDLLFLVVVVTLVLPGLLALAPTLAWRLSPRAGESLHRGLVAVLFTAFASQVFAHVFNMPSVPHYALAAALAILATWVYSSVPAIRMFMTYLGPSVLIFPTLFLLHPSMAAFVRAVDVSKQAAAAMPATAPPIVMVVFDQLPLTSLLSESGAIDPRYPHFAALADDATWFRNATTMAELTEWAMPAILTGLAPRRGRLPTVQDYPFNLFTTLGTTYRHEVIEPITYLCPERLCETSAPVSERLGVLTLDSSIVYLHTALPWDLRALLPPLTQDWKNFVRAQSLQMRWINARDSDRREAPRRFIGGISRADPQPTLYFLHALLPHEPYVYLRSGQQFTEDTRLFGLKPTGRWVHEPWPVVQAYGRHLIQLQYVDTLIGQLTDKLKAEGLYDKSLIIITADHGVSFRPGRPFKGVDEETLPDIMAVPLFVKLPGQRSPVVSDRNVQTIDIVPTIADVLKTTLPWQPDGRSALASGAAPTMKVIRHTGATRQMTVDTQDFATRRGDAVVRKFKLFGADSADMMPTTAYHAELIGRPVDAVDRSDDGPLHVVVDRPWQYLKFDPAGPTLLGILSGRMLDNRGNQTRVSLAIVVNGHIRATTSTYRFSGDEVWTAFIPPRHFRAGANEVEVFVIRDRPGGVRLERAYASSARPETLNLASTGAHDYWFVRQSGFYDREGGPIPYRWTNGDAALAVPFDRGERPRSVRIGVAKARSATPLTVSLNGCTVFEGAVDETPWFRTFALDHCSRSTFEGSEVRISLKSATAPEKGPGSRQIGIAVEAVNLLVEPWPPARPLPSTSLATVEPLEPVKAAIAAGSTLDVQLTNRGKSVWLRPGESSERGDGIDIALRWRTRGANGPDAEQRMALPRSVYPQDRTVFTVPVVVPDQLRNHGPWQLTIAPVFHDGRPVRVEPPFAIEVVEGGK